MRALLKGELAKQGVVKHWVMDRWKDIIGVKGQNREEDIVSLRHVSSADNAHFMIDAYENLAAAIYATIHSGENVVAPSNNI
jgi:hypothetical protein